MRRASRRRGDAGFDPARTGVSCKRKPASSRQALYALVVKLMLRNCIGLSSQQTDGRLPIGRVGIDEAIVTAMRQPHAPQNDEAAGHSGHARTRGEWSISYGGC